MPISTNSPLGLITGNLPIEEEDGKLKTVFSSYKSKSGGKAEKHFLRRSNDNGQFKGILSTSPHEDSIYDVSTTNVVTRLSEAGDHLALSYGDFAYLKDLGVYPNNRLIVCRRFPIGVVDDLYSVEKDSIQPPRSTVLSYIKEDEDFLTFDFSESWANAEVSFTKLLNDLGNDFGFKLGGGLGSILEGGINAVPLPGASLLLQRQIMASLGLFGDGVTYNSETGNFEKEGQKVDVPPIPQGDPNLIKEARIRSLLDENESGSGLECKIKVKFTVVYEQKFIDGNDPTIIYADILHNLLNMGTSPASFYLGKQVDAGQEVSKLLNKLTESPDEVITDFLDSIIKVVSEQIKKVGDALEKAQESKRSSSDEDPGNNPTQILEDASALIGEVLKGIPDYVKNFIKQKYRIKFLGIINALTGGPSTPWHVTIGNPFRPIFCSGDMLCTGVNVKLGPQLSFNDLPTYIEAEISLESARNIGLQEIFAKLNSGGIRTVSKTETPKDYDYNVSISADYWNNGYSITS